MQVFLKKPERYSTE